MQNVRNNASKTPEPGGPPSPGFLDSPDSMRVRKMEPKPSKGNTKRIRSLTQGDSSSTSKLPPKSLRSPSPTYSPQPSRGSPSAMAVRSKAGSPAPSTPPSDKGNGSPDDADQEHVQVVVRPRPLQVQEIEKGQANSISVTEDRKHLKLFFPGERVNKNDEPPEKHYGFSYCAHRETNQERFFEECGVKELIRSVSRGFSASVIAYGQTGSGKTYTTVGEDGSLRESDLKDDSGSLGLVPRSLQFLFQLCQQEPESSWHVSATYCEIYNEQVYDLLSQSSEPLPIKWETLGNNRRKSTGNLKNIKGHYYVEKLSNVPCKRAQDVLDVLAEGSRVRRVRSHQLNMQSSRSHSIFTVYVTWTSEIEKQDGQVVKTSKTSKIVFVDLAGSERLKQTQSTGEGLKETTNINRSLFALGNVISALSDKPKRPRRQNTTSSLPAPSKDKDVGQIVVPYRDSVLTKLLMDSLGGNCYTIMIACVTPSDAYVDETMNTLNYASRACRIRNHPTITESNSWTEIVTTLQKQIRELYLENEKLRQQVRESQSDRSAQSDKDSRRDQGGSADSPLPPGYRQLVKFADKGADSAENTQNENPSQEDGGKEESPMSGKPSLSIDTGSSPDFVPALPKSCKRADDYEEKQKKTRANSISESATPLPQRGSTVSAKDLMFGPKSVAKRRRSLPGGRAPIDELWTPRGSPIGSKTPNKHMLPPVSGRRTDKSEAETAEGDRNEGGGSNLNGSERDTQQRATNGVAKQARNSFSTKNSTGLGVRFSDMNSSREDIQNDGKRNKSRRSSTTSVYGPNRRADDGRSSMTKHNTSEESSTSTYGVVGGSSTFTKRRRHSISSAATYHKEIRDGQSRPPKPDLSRDGERQTHRNRRKKQQEPGESEGNSNRRRSKDNATNRNDRRHSDRLNIYAHPAVTSSESAGSSSADPYAHPNALLHPLVSEDKGDEKGFKKSSFSSLTQQREGENGVQLWERIEELNHRAMQLLVKLSSQEEQLRSRAIPEEE